MTRRALTVPNPSRLALTCRRLAASEAGRFLTRSASLSAISGREKIFGTLQIRVWDLGVGYFRLKNMESAVFTNFFDHISCNTALKRTKQFED